MTSAENEVSNIEMLKKAVTFSQENLAALRAGDIMNLKDDLWEFTGRAYTLDERKEDFMKRLSVEQLGEIQKAFKTTFAELAGGKMTDGRMSVVWRADGPNAYFVAMTDAKSKPFDYGIYSLNLVDAAMITLIGHLVRSRATPEQFRRCPECESLFFLGRKPDNRNFYCSQRCAVRVAVRNSRNNKEKKRVRKKQRA